MMLVSDKTYLLKKNEALYEATLNEFSSNPFDLASTNIIIKNSDYNKGSFYYRFKTKEEIYFALIDDIYVKGIDLLNRDNIKLNYINEEKQLVELLFKNIKSLWEEDPRYYNLLRRIYNENSFIKQMILTNCIESSQTRIVNRLIDIFKQRKYPYIDIFINNLYSLLFNYFNGFKGVNQELEDIYMFLLNHRVEYKLEPVTSKIDITDFPGDLNYICTNDDTLDLNPFDEYRLSKQIINKNMVLETIRNKLKIKQITIANIIDAGIKKSIRDLSFFIDLKSVSFANTSYHLLKYSEKIVLLMIFNSFIGKEYILLDYLISNHSPKEIEILFNQMLPKIAKLSKIVVVDKSIYPNFISNFRVYTYKNGELRGIDSKELIDKESDYIVNYYEDGLLKTKLFKKDDQLLIQYLKNKKIQNISSYSKLEFKDIKESKR